MTEPRKTPRTDVRTWKTATGETVVFASVAQDLEIETQELAEELGRAVSLIGVLESAAQCTAVPGDYPMGALDELNAALARHRAKQEVQS